MKISCFCEIEFLKRFTNNIPDANPYSSNNDFDIWRNFKKLIFENSRLTIDNKNKLTEWVNDNRENKLAVFLFKKIVEIKEMLIDEFDFETINPHTIFFLADNKKCKKLEEDYGMLFISNETQNENSRIIFGFEQSPIPITKNGKYSNYSFLNTFHHPCNAMIINDSYLLKEKDDTYNENLIAILDFLLPDNLKKDKFQLLILSGDNKTNIDVNSRYLFIKREINKLRTYPIELKIETKEAHHNRDILTNYLRISVGHKFTLFIKQKATINDDLTVHSFIGNQSEMEVVNDRKNDYRKLEKDTNNIGSQVVVIPKEQAGKVTNRLLK